MHSFSDYQLGATVLLTLLAVSVFIYIRYFYVDFAPIAGLPETPGASPISGHLYLLGQDHPTTAQKWAVSNSWPVYQIRMGNRRAIILNSFDSAKEFIITRQTATIDRPRLYTLYTYFPQDIHILDLSED